MSKKTWVILIASLFACCLLSSCKEQPAETEAPSQTEETKGAEAPVFNDSTVLYYNIDWEEYNGKADDSLTSREKNLDDGYFHLMLATEGEIKEVLIKSRIMTNKADSNPVVALTFSKDNIVSEVYPVTDIGGKIAAKSYFVTSSEGSNLIVNTNNTNSGDEISYTVKSGAKIFDVSATEDMSVAETALEEMDEILAVSDASGALTHVWVLSRASQSKGRGGCICGANDSGAPHKEGCDGTILYYWKPWTNLTALPTENGYWYLDVEGGVIELDEGFRFRTSVDMYIDLNGHTVLGPSVNGSNTSVYFCGDASIKCSITLLDSVGTGKIILRDLVSPDGTKAASLQSRFMVYTGPKHSFTMYGGTIDGSELYGYGGNGSIIRAINGAYLNIHGGTIIGVTPTANTGGAVFCSGTMTMTGGTIRGGHAKKGGNVFIGSYDSNEGTKYGSFIMTGGEILDGDATTCGGNVVYYYEGVFEQTGGTISGGTSPKSPDVYMYPKYDPAA